MFLVPRVFLLLPLPLRLVFLSSPFRALEPFFSVDSFIPYIDTSEMGSSAVSSFYEFEIISYSLHTTFYFLVSITFWYSFYRFLFPV